MLALLQIVGISLMFLLPIILACAYGAKYSESVGLRSDEVKDMNERLNRDLPIDLELEEMAYLFKRDFNQEILLFRADIQKQFETASREIASL